MVDVSWVLGYGALGLVVTGQCVVDGEVVVEVETPPGRRVCCERCGHRARSKGRRRTRLRDACIPGGHRVRVVWNKRLWVCGNADCETKTWTEQHCLAKPRCQLTRRAAAHAVEVLAAVEGSVAGVARSLAVGLAHRLVSS